MSFVDNKMLKIHKELNNRERSLIEMDKRRNTMSMLSDGSKRILKNSQACQGSMKSSHISPSTVHLDITPDK